MIKVVLKRQSESYTWREIGRCCSVYFVIVNKFVSAHNIIIVSSALSSFMNVKIINSGIYFWSTNIFIYFIFMHKKEVTYSSIKYQTGLLLSP